MCVKDKIGVKFGIGLLTITLITGCIGGYIFYEIHNSLSDKIGFSVTGELEDRTKVSYKVKRKHPLSFQTLEEVIYRKNGDNILIDYSNLKKHYQVKIRHFFRQNKNQKTLIAEALTGSLDEFNEDPNNYFLFGVDTRGNDNGDFFIDLYIAGKN